MKAKLKEIRERSVEDLNKEIAEKQRHLFDLRSQAVTEKLEDPTQLGKTRKEIARIRTILREREIAANPPKAPAAPAKRSDDKKPRPEKQVARRRGRVRGPKKRGDKAAKAAALAK
jgi:large subunit ribosomal protein L29